MDQTTDIQASEELTLPGNHAAASADGLVVDNANDNAGQEEGFEIVLKDDEKPKQDPATNAEFARRRIERKRQRELEQQMEAVKRGELPEHLRVNPELPKQPDPNDYLSEDALAKYDYDQSRALAAFQQANSEWQIKAMDARSQAVAEQGRKTQEFTQQSAQYVEAARKHYDAAEKLNIPDYQEKEDAFMQLVPPAVGADIMLLFPEKSAALMYHLGANPEKTRQLLAMDGQSALIELTRLSERLTLKPRAKPVSEAPLVGLDSRLTTAENDIDYLTDEVVAIQNTLSDHETRIDALEYATTRKKSEVVYSGVSVTIPTAPTNLVSLLKTLTPSSGTLAPFFDTVNNKMVVFNENKTLFFKLSIVGTWPSGTANRSMQLTFSGSVPDTLVSSRNAATTTDNILLATFFSVDKDGFLATNGSTLTIQSNGAAFTATTIKIIAEQ